VPAWGLGQTGYTSLDININLDLRKWTTYIIPPVTFNEEKLNFTTAQNPNKTLKVDIRDMTSPGFTRRPVEIVQIPNDLDRDLGAQYLWFNEFSQKKTSIQFNNFGCSVFKLPGNIYDPSGLRTDKDGNPTTKKGVWLAAYQFNIYLDKTFALRSTGAGYYSTTSGSFIRSHYHLNYTEGSQTPGSVENEPSRIGVFPYEKPWSATYPEKYSIPKKPIQQRILYGPDRLQYPTSTKSNPIYYIEEPAYSDGDLVGIPAPGSIGNAGGFGVQYVGTVWFSNRIANVATNSYMYKYESGVSWTETYANGYEPYWTASNNPYKKESFPFAGLSKVVGGEKYQRLECGYGYFVRPQGWSRIVRQDWGADSPQDILNMTNAGSSDNPGPSIVPSGIIGSWFYNKMYPLTLYNLDNQNLALHLGSQSTIKEGTLDFYRIVESGPDVSGNFVNISPNNNFVIPTYSQLRIEGAAHCYNILITNKGVVEVSLKNPYRASVRIISADGSNSGKFVSPSDYIILQPNEGFQVADVPAQAVWPKENNYLNSIENSLPFGKETSYDKDKYLELLGGQKNAYWRHSVDFTSILLPGNDQYNSDTNKYEKSVYKIDVTYYNKFYWTLHKFIDTYGASAALSYMMLAGDAVQSKAVGNKGKFEKVILQYARNSLFTSEGKNDMQIKSTNMYGDATATATNVYYVRTATSGSQNGLIHEGIGKNFYYGKEVYYEESEFNKKNKKTWVELSSVVIEGPTSSLWGEFNDGNKDYGYGRYSP